jgi:ribosome biogenesis protein SSF1/2
MQKKRRTHVDTEALFAASKETVPRSFVVKKGRVRLSLPAQCALPELQHDIMLL